MSLRESTSSSGRLNEDLQTEMTVLKHMQREAAMAACHQQQPSRSKFMITDILGNGKLQSNGNSEHHHHNTASASDSRTTPSPQPRDLSVYLQHHRSTPDNDEDSDCDSSECQCWQKFWIFRELFFLVIYFIYHSATWNHPTAGKSRVLCFFSRVVFFTIRILMRAIWNNVRGEKGKKS